MTQLLEPDPRYPVGRFDPAAEVPHAARGALIDVIAELPALLRTEVAALNERVLETPYRDGGWTIRQVVHHLPDSHMNAFTRFRLALTEDWPTIKPYDEAAWSQLVDSRTAPLEPSLAILDGLHDRWVRLLRAMDAEDYEARGVVHPEWKSRLSNGTLLRLYAWHSRHHLAHVRQAKAIAGVV